jgi:sarcosine oxidase subunit beta
MRANFDAIIIGAGIIGACTALQLARRGFRTLNIDQQPAAGYGSTANSCAIIRTVYSTLQGTALAWENVSHWREWAEFVQPVADSDLARYRETGVVAIKRDASALAVLREHHRALGIPYQEWSVADLEARMPYLDLKSYWPPRRPDERDFGQPNETNITGAFFVPAGGYVSDPTLAVRNVQQAAEALGSVFRFRSTVGAILRRDGRVAGVELVRGGRITAPVVVNAAGPHSGRVNDMAGVAGDMQIRTRPMRHEVHRVPAPAQVDYDRSGMVLSDEDVGGYCRPEVGNALLIGSQDPDCDPAEWVDYPDTFDREVSTAQWQAQVYRMAQRIPGLPIPTHPQGVADLYDVSDDWIPVYDRSSLDGFYMAIGTSGNQFKNGPVVGQMMAALIERCEQGHDHDRDPVSIRGRYTGARLDLGFYSRLRTVNRDSSFSVMG